MWRSTRRGRSRPPRSTPSRLSLACPPPEALRRRTLRVNPPSGQFGLAGSGSQAVPLGRVQPVVRLGRPGPGETVAARPGRRPTRPARERRGATPPEAGRRAARELPTRLRPHAAGPPAGGPGLRRTGGSARPGLPATAPRPIAERGADPLPARPAGRFRAGTGVGGAARLPGPALPGRSPPTGPRATGVTGAGDGRRTQDAADDGRGVGSGGVGCGVPARRFPTLIAADAATPGTKRGVKGGHRGIRHRIRRRLVCGDFPRGFGRVASIRRTTKLSSGGGRVSYELQKTYLPPPSAAAPGSASDAHPPGGSSPGSSCQTMLACCASVSLS